MSGAIDAVYVFDHNNFSILQHEYRSRPLAAADVIRLYLDQPAPRPSLIYLPNTSPQTLLFSLSASSLLFIASASSEVEPLLVLEFLHRLVDAFEDFLGPPILPGKIEANYDVVAQLLGEMCDTGIVCNTESNALKDLVDAPGWVEKLFNNVGLQGSAITSAASNTLSLQAPTLNLQNNGPALPWRRANVRHTSNELYVDIIEDVSILMAPSGRILSAFAFGTIAFTSKLSGVPDLTLMLSAPGGKTGLAAAFELPVFHPCVRLARWRERPGELSFVPPDGRFVLAGYEVDLLPSSSKANTTLSSLNIPVSIEVRKGLGPIGTDFEIIAQISATSSGSNTPSSNQAGRTGIGSRLGTSSPAFGSSSNSPLLENVIVTIPLPRTVRNVTNVKATRGEATYSAINGSIEWKIPTKEPNTNKTTRTATLRCTVAGDNINLEDTSDLGIVGASNEYAVEEYQSTASSTAKTVPSGSSNTPTERDVTRIKQNAILMPSSATVSFSIKNWLASGVKVESINVNVKQSKGFTESVKPFKGVKYLTVSHQGLEIRC